MIVRFVDIGGIVDDRGLDFLFITCMLQISLQALFNVKFVLYLSSHCVWKQFSRFWLYLPFL
jgi:hypothetical protein